MGWCGGCYCCCGCQDDWWGGVDSRASNSPCTVKIESTSYVDKIRGKKRAKNTRRQLLLYILYTMKTSKMPVFVPSSHSLISKRAHSVLIICIKPCLPLSCSMDSWTQRSRPGVKTSYMYLFIYTYAPLVHVFSTGDHGLDLSHWLQYNTTQYSFIMSWQNAAQRERSNIKYNTIHKSK